jgi:hypothetical protein
MKNIGLILCLILSLVVTTTAVAWKEPLQKQDSVKMKAANQRFSVPLNKGWCALVKAGITTATDEVNPALYFVVTGGYRISPKFSAGIGTGFIQTHGSYDESRMQHFYISQPNDWVYITSDEIAVPFVPLFFDLRFSFTKRRVSPYISGSIGGSFPVVQKINTTWYYQMNSNPKVPYSMEVTSVNPGMYFAINPGLKCYVTDKYYLDILFGWDFSSNKMTGRLPEDKASMTLNSSSFHLNIGFGF